jgi:hypothetical protein
MEILIVGDGRARLPLSDFASLGPLAGQPCSLSASAT